MALTIKPTGKTLGARAEGLDLSNPITPQERAQLMQALGEYGVISYPNQNLTPTQLRDFAANFGALEINVAGAYQEANLPEVMVLSNIVENGKPLGLSDAGQDWHTDMSYNTMIAFTNILYGMRIPLRDGQPLGNTEFCNMHAAYEDLSDDLKQRLQGMTVEHDFNKFWDMMRRERGSTRPPLTAEQRAARPPVSHPLFLDHPITGRKVLYCNPGYAMRINGLDAQESDDLLEFFFKHQTQPKYQYAHRWSVNDVLMWDNMGTIHNAKPDYRPDEPRLIKRCQVMATEFFHADGSARQGQAHHGVAAK